MQHLKILLNKKERRKNIRETRPKSTS